MTQFNLNCTLPLTIVNYVDQPNTRGTFDILSTCLTTIFLCTYFVQHPNVPTHEPTHSNKGKIASISKQVGMMVFTLLAPEFLLLKAIGYLLCAVALAEQIRERAKKDGAELSRIHSFFTNMGAFVVYFKEVTPDRRVQMATSSSLLTPGSPQSKDLNANNSRLKVTNSITATKIDCEKALPRSSTTSTTISKTSSNSTTAVQPKKEITSPPDKRLRRMLTLRENLLPALNGKNSFLVKAVIADLRRRISQAKIWVSPASLLPSTI